MDYGRSSVTESSKDSREDSTTTTTDPPDDAPDDDDVPNEHPTFLIAKDAASRHGK